MSEKNTKIKSRKDILTPFLITIIVSTILYFGLKTLEPVFANNTLYPRAFHKNGKKWIL